MRFVIALLIGMLAGCASAPVQVTPPLRTVAWMAPEAKRTDLLNASSIGRLFHGRGVPGDGGAGKIEHVVFIVQENRSLNNLFMGYPGAYTVSSGKDSKGGTIALQQVS